MRKRSAERPAIVGALNHSLLRHHKRFLVAAAAAVAAWWPAGLLFAPQLRLVVVSDVFFFVYLVLMLHLSRGSTTEGLRARAATDDESFGVIAVLTSGAIVVSIASVFVLINDPAGFDRQDLVLTLTTLPLGWLTLHAMASHNYANIYYGRDRHDRESPHRGGLDFPGDDEPGSIDFVYFAFVIGMTAQTADVAITTSRMRAMVLAHSIASFLFNTVLVAVAVNAAVGAAH